MLVEYGLPVKIPDIVASASGKLISQGAEALVFQIPEKDQIAKFRPAKPWRLQELDELLRKRRTTQEARVLQKLSEAQIGAPQLISVDAKLGLIYMQLIEGKSLKQATWDAAEPVEVVSLYKQYGASIARMHHLNIVHGDLTTSNAMVDLKNSIQIIDFGLSSQAASIEDKAVDLYVLERAIQSTHPQESQLLMHEALLPEYFRVSEELDKANNAKVLARLELVRKRGRKRTQLG